MPREILAKLPHELVVEIKERYETLGEKYMTDEVYPDGRRINGMMFTDRIENCREEIVDAVFCIIGQIFKDTPEPNGPSENLYFLLDGLIHIYSTLVILEETGEYAIDVRPM